MYEYNAKVINVVDGDTIDLDVDLGFRIHHTIRARMLYIDTPEKRTKDAAEKELGIKCTEIAAKILMNKEVVIKSEKEEDDLDTDSFGRWLIYLSLGDNNIINIYNEYGMNKKAITYSADKINETWNKIVGENSNAKF